MSRIQGGRLAVRRRCDFSEYCLRLTGMKNSICGVTGMSREQERVTTLEEEVAHLRLQNEELSGELHKQWLHIEALERNMRALENRLAGFEASQDAPEANVKPPHW